jgi:hypothetical protein
MQMTRIASITLATVLFLVPVVAEAWTIQLVGTMTNNGRQTAISLPIRTPDFASKAECERNIPRAIDGALRNADFEGATVTQLPGYRLRMVWPGGVTGIAQYICIPGG